MIFLGRLVKLDMHWYFGFKSWVVKAVFTRWIILLNICEVNILEFVEGALARFLLSTDCVKSVQALLGVLHVCRRLTVNHKDILLLLGTFGGDTSVSGPLRHFKFK